MVIDKFTFLLQVLIDNHITRKGPEKSFSKTRYGKKISYKKEVKAFFIK